MLALSCNKFDDSAIWNKLNDHEGRIAYLEEVCKTMNTNIVTLQTLVTALEANDYIINASPLVAIHSHSSLASLLSFMMALMEQMEKTVSMERMESLLL